METEVETKEEEQRPRGATGTPLPRGEAETPE